MRNRLIEPCICNGRMLHERGGGCIISMGNFVESERNMTDDKVERMDKQELRKFMQTYARLVYSRALMHIPSEALALEATRATFEEAAEQIQQGRALPNTEIWLLALTDNCCLRFAGQSNAQEEEFTAQQAPVEVFEQGPAEVPAIEEPERQMLRAQIDGRPVLKAREGAPSGEPVQTSMPAQPIVPIQPVMPVLPLAATQPVAAVRPMPVQSSAAAAQPQWPEEEEAPVFFEAPARRSRQIAESDLELEEDDEPEAKVSSVFLLFLLVIVALCLLWMLVVMLMSRGIIPNADRGFAEWFNHNVFELF